MNRIADGCESKSDACAGCFGCRRGGGRKRKGLAGGRRGAGGVVVGARQVEGGQATGLVSLGGGESGSSAALSLALGASQRTVQGALESLAAEGRVQSLGRARARRW